MVKALDDADDAQKKARQSIKRANEDIQSAKIDLEEVFDQPALFRATQI